MTANEGMLIVYIRYTMTQGGNGGFVGEGYALTATVTDMIGRNCGVGIMKRGYRKILGSAIEARGVHLVLLRGDF